MSKIKLIKTEADYQKARKELKTLDPETDEAEVLAFLIKQFEKKRVVQPTIPKAPPNMTQQQFDRERLNRDILKFLSKGGKIKKYPIQTRSDTLKKVRSEFVNNKRREKAEIDFCLDE